MSRRRIDVAGGRVYDGDMAKASAVIAPEDAVRIQPTGTRPPTVLQEYDRLRQKAFAEKLRALRGTVHLDIDLDELRGRNR